MDPQNKPTAIRGSRVRLIATTDPDTRLRPGTLGTISLVDDAGTIHVNWDDGSRLGLIPDVDDFEGIDDNQSADTP